jgi:DNA-3-methyladenine glycosylase
VAEKGRWCLVWQILSTCVGKATDVAMPEKSLKKQQLARAFFARSVHEVAPELIGALFLVDGIGGPIVEVEAYHHTDPAAHSFGGPTARNAVMFGPPGYAYVYRSYGIHWCVNFVCEAENSASAVLIRALMPTKGLPAMRRRRGLEDERLLCAGPGRLCEALAITRAHNGMALDEPPFALFAGTSPVEIAAGPRIGISKAAELPWRYGLAGSRFLSRPFRAAKS